MAQKKKACRDLNLINSQSYMDYSHEVVSRLILLDLASAVASAVAFSDFYIK